MERVDLVVHPLCLKLTGIKKAKNATEGTFSTYHWVAVALLNGRVSISQFSDACIARVDLRTKRRLPRAQLLQNAARSHVHAAQYHDSRMICNCNCLPQSFGLA